MIYVLLIAVLVVMGLLVTIGMARSAGRADEAIDQNYEREVAEVAQRNGRPRRYERHK